MPACGAPAPGCENPPPGCAAAREPPPPPRWADDREPPPLPSCADAALPPSPPDFFLPAEAICGAIKAREKQIQMNALMNCHMRGLGLHKKHYVLASLNAESSPDFFSKAVSWS